MSTTATRLASFAAAALLTLGTVSTMNSLASDTYRTASNEQLQATPMASAQQVTVTARRVRA
jgi:hypothetical protein